MPPIIYDENGTAKGVTVDIAKALGKKIGYQVESKTAGRCGKSSERAGRGERLVADCERRIEEACNVGRSDRSDESPGL